MNSHDNIERSRQIEFGRSFTGGIAQKPARGRGHETVLRAIQGSGKPIHVEKLDGTIKVGLLYAFDQYTLTVQTADGIRRIIFKHDISEFYTKEVTDAKGA